MLELRAGLIQVALGRKDPDLVIKNIKLVNVYSGEVLEGQEVAVWQGRIAYVGPKAKEGEKTETADGRGMYLVPGFIDVHGHADFVSNPLALADAILPTGTTGMLTDTHDICGALGMKGLELMLNITEDIPFRYYMAAPATIPPLPEFEGEEIFSRELVEKSLSHPRVLAVSEVTSWARLLTPESALVDKLVIADRLGKKIEGHMAGCSYDKLNALTGCGFTSCHESITAQEALDRLRLGLHVILRHGSIRSDLEELSRLVTENSGIDTGRVMLSPDWFNPQDVRKYGYINHLVAFAVEQGISPVKAIQMVTINPATYLGLEKEIGGIAPGRWADMLLVERLENPFPQKVWVGGKAVAEDGKMLVKFPSFPVIPLSEWMPGRIPDLPAKKSDFEISPDELLSEHSIQIPVIHMINKTITKVLNQEIPVTNGRVDISQIEGLLKISLWSYEIKGWRTGLLSGFGANVGGLVSSIAHEVHAPMVVGSNEQDMALAVNYMAEIGGGIVLVDNGKVVGELRMTTGGIASNANVFEVAEKWDSLNRYLQEKGCPWDDPLFGLGFLCFTGLPYVRMTAKGVLDIRKKEIIFSQ